MPRFFRRDREQSGLATLNAEMLKGRDHGRVQVVAESYYQDAIKNAVIKLLRDGEIYETTAVLMREPDNKHDSNAVAVYLESSGKVGHLSRDNAIAYQPLLQRLAKKKMVGSCRAVVVGGTIDKPNWGVFLDLADPENALDEP
jgi:hypothetical protein